MDTSEIETIIPDFVISEVTSIQDSDTGGASTESRNGKMCPICKKILPPQANLSFHQMLHPWTEKPYACDKCLYVCMAREELSEHCKKAHPSNRKYICAICDKEFGNVRSLNKHKPTHALVLPFSCAYCDKGFPEYGYWRQHEVAHKTAKYQCEDCLVRFTTLKIYTDHRDKMPCKTIVLGCCAEMFSTRMEYVKHCFEHHRFQKKDEHGCEFCGKLYAFKCLLNIHKRHCRLRTNKSSSNQDSETVQLPAEANMETIVPDVESNIPASALIPVDRETEKGKRKVYRCDLCDKTFLTKSWLVHHRQRHVDPTYTKYICQLCNKKYGSYSALYYHKQRTHLKIRRFTCTHCEKAFYDSQSLKDHLTSHTGERPYACDYCPRRFRNRSSKVEHHRVHTGERPYHCRFCDMSFKRRDAKMSHERRHTGEKPYVCRVCDRSFTQYSTLHSHERKHQPPFSCTLCELEFMSRDEFVVHKKVHGNSVVEPVSYTIRDSSQPVQMSTDTEGNVYIQYQAA